MGVAPLWKIIEELNAAVLTTLEEQSGRKQELQHADGIVAQRLNGQILGADTNGIMTQCISATYGGGQYNGKVPLEIFFYKICHLLQSWSHVVFVFDGPGRPNMKRGKHVPSDREIDWYGPCEELIRKAGFHVHQAPGEAEAELAALNEKNLIDVILTPDSDTFIFGGKSILRCSARRYRSNPNDPDVFDLYTMSALAEKDPATFTRGGLLLFVLLVGGDYNPGIAGCGQGTAHGLAKCGFGDSLYTACCKLEGSARRNFITTWIQDVCKELRTNSQKCANVCNHRVADSLCEEVFPSNEVIDLYIHPLTSFSPGQTAVGLPAWTFEEPDICGLANIAVQHLGFRTREDIIGGFYSNLWPGIFKQMLLAQHSFNPADDTIRSSKYKAAVIKVRQENRRTQRISTIPVWYRVTLSTAHLRSTLENALTKVETKTSGGKRKRGNSKHTDMSKLAIWVPSMFLPPLLKASMKARRVPTPRKRPTSKPANESNAYSATIDSLFGTLNDILDTKDDEPVAESSAMGAERTTKLAPFPMPDAAQSSEFSSHTSLTTTKDSACPTASATHHGTNFIDLTIDEEPITASNSATAEDSTVFRSLGFIDFTVEDGKDISDRRM